MTRVERSWKAMLLQVISVARKGDTVVVGTEQQRQWAIEALKQMRLYDHVIIHFDKDSVLPHLAAMRRGGLSSPPLLTPGQG